jgi:hypothetical protein
LGNIHDVALKGSGKNASQSKVPIKKHWCLRAISIALLSLAVADATILERRMARAGNPDFQGRRLADKYF